MTLARLAHRYVLVALLVALSAPLRAQQLEPETGTFAGYGPPSPYDLFLRRALLEDDNYRLCQVVVLPSFAPEYAVYFIEPPDGPPVVISRTLKQQLWTSMMNEMTKSCPDGAISLDAMTQSVALEKVRETTETRKAELSAKSAAKIGAVCRDVLLRVRYRMSPVVGLDGTTYHVGHSTRGGFLSGQTWSPTPGSLPAEFVQLGEKLRAYAEAEPAARAQAEALLLAQASRVAGSLQKSQ